MGKWGSVECESGVGDGVGGEWGKWGSGKWGWRNGRWGRWGVGGSACIHSYRKTKHLSTEKLRWDSEHMISQVHCLWFSDIYEALKESMYIHIHVPPILRVLGRVQEHGESDTRSDVERGQVTFCLDVDPCHLLTEGLWEGGGREVGRGEGGREGRE